MNDWPKVLIAIVDKQQQQKQQPQQQQQPQPQQQHEKQFRAFYCGLILPLRTFVPTHQFGSAINAPLCYRISSVVPSMRHCATVPTHPIV